MIDIDHAVLLVVDVQNGFVNDQSKHVLPTIANLTAQWADSGRPAVFTRYWNYPGSPWERLIGWRALYAPPETDLAPELLELASKPNAHTLDKRVYTALTAEGTDLLTELGVTDVVICGIATDACVFKTALDAFEQGFTPWVVRDAVASNATRHKAAEIHDSALLLISRLVGDRQVIDSRDILDSLAHTTEVSKP